METVTHSAGQIDDHLFRNALEKGQLFEKRRDRNRFFVDRDRNLFRRKCENGCKQFPAHRAGKGSLPENLIAIFPCLKNGFADSSAGQATGKHQFSGRFFAFHGLPVCVQFPAAPGFLRKLELEFALPQSHFAEVTDMDSRGKLHRSNRYDNCECQYCPKELHTTSCFSSGDIQKFLFDVFFIFYCNVIFL